MSPRIPSQFLEADPLFQYPYPYQIPVIYQLPDIKQSVNKQIQEGQIVSYKFPINFRYKIKNQHNLNLTTSCGTI